MNINIMNTKRGFMNVKIFLITKNSSLMRSKNKDHTINRDKLMLSKYE